MTRSIAVMLLLLTSSCSNGERYPDAAAFKSDVEQWGVVGRSLNVAIAEFVKRGFTCGEAYCSRGVGGPVCAQQLRVNLSVDASGNVSEFAVQTIDGKLPDVCL